MSCTYNLIVKKKILKNKITWHDIHLFMIPGICPFAGFIVIDGYIHLGTFCGDETFTLPVGIGIYLSTLELTIIRYSLYKLGEVTFSFGVQVQTIDSPGVSSVNPCYTYKQQLSIETICDVDYFTNGQNMVGIKHLTHHYQEYYDIHEMDPTSPTHAHVHLQWFHCYQVTGNCTFSFDDGSRVTAHWWSLKETFYSTDPMFLEDDSTTTHLVIDTHYLQYFMIL